MKLLDEGTPNPGGEALIAELRWIHDIIRGNLATIAAVAEQVAGGALAEQVRAQIDELAATSVVWTLRVNCMRYCQLVHGHHHHEDVGWFPGLRRADPSIHSVIDKLEADHRIVSKYLDTVEAAAARVETDMTARSELVAALGALAAHLLAHLDYEENSLAPTLRRLVT
jgi:hypothetical protein